MPTLEQIESRKKLADFIEAARGQVRGVAGRVKSALYGRPDEELKGWIERGRALSEIEDSPGYRLIVSQAHREIEWAREQLELGTDHDTEMRAYLKALRFLDDFLLTTRRSADIASGVLAGREGAIGRDSMQFVKNARVEN